MARNDYPVVINLLYFVIILAEIKVDRNINVDTVKKVCLHFFIWLL